MTFRDFISGAILIEPAMSAGNLPDQPNLNYPVLVAESRHDHLNSLLFPVASILFNGYISSEYEPKADNWLYVGTNTPSAWKYYFKQSGIDLLNGSKVTILSAPSWPLSYLEGQWDELSDKNNWSWRENYFTDTLEQLPIIDVLMQEAVGNTSYHKGLFNLGEWNESAARIGFQSPKPLNSIVFANGRSLFLAVTNGVQYVNAQDVVSQSVYSESIDYDTKFFSKDAFAHFGAGLVGWLDPVGSHSDYRPHTNSPNIQVWDLVNSLMLGQITDSNISSPSGSITRK